MLCPNCKKEIPDGTQFCPECGVNVNGSVAPVKQKKPITKKWWFWVIIVVVVILFISIIGGGNDSTDTSVNSGDAVVEQSDGVTTTEKVAETTTTVSAGSSDGKYYAGDVLNCGDVSITFVSAEKWTGYNQYLPPENGNIIIRLSFDVVNNGTSDFAISYFDFNGYADNQSAEQYYTDNDLSATLSAGRNTSGYIYFEVPEDTKVLEVEYEVNFWTEEKAVFVVEL